MFSCIDLWDTRRPIHYYFFKTLWGKIGRLFFFFLGQKRNRACFILCCHKPFQVIRRHLANQQQSSACFKFLRYINATLTTVKLTWQRRSSHWGSWLCHHFTTRHFEILSWRKKYYNCKISFWFHIWLISRHCIKLPPPQKKTFMLWEHGLKKKIVKMCWLEIHMNFSRFFFADSASDIFSVANQGFIMITITISHVIYLVPLIN